MDARLSQEGSPTDGVGSLDVRTRVVSHHKEASFSELADHCLPHEVKGGQFWFPKVVCPEVEGVPFAVLLEHVVEGPESHPRSVVPSCKSNVVLRGKVRRQLKPIPLSLREQVMDDCKCCLIRTDIVEGEDSLYFLSPFVVATRKTTPSQPPFHLFLDFFDVFPVNVEGKRRVCFQLLVHAVVDGVQLISENVVGDAHIEHNLLYFQRTSQ
jgi:hypothetical protein